MKKSFLKYLVFFSVMLTAMTAFAQTNTITGTVKDNTGMPIPGANVLIKNSTNGVQTDFDGKFAIKAKPEDVLVASFIGMKTMETKVGNQANVNIKLEEEQDNNLEEVVVVGYGTQKKKLTTGSLSSIKTDNFVERPISRVDQGMVGQIAGVRVKQTSGLPGQPFSINIRGTGSISAGNEPLYVIDGFPITTEGSNSNGNFANGSPLDNMNPNDIASIEVLKDAAAAAIYGSRAANGVVLITKQENLNLLLTPILDYPKKLKELICWMVNNG